jgi:hypothetical protein
MTTRLRLSAALILGFALAGCKSQGELVVDQGVGITAVRTTCPAVGVPDYFGIEHGRVRGDHQRALDL